MLLSEDLRHISHIEADRFDNAVAYLVCLFDVSAVEIVGSIVVELPCRTSQYHIWLQARKISGIEEFEFDDIKKPIPVDYINHST